MIGAKAANTTAYHPQANAIVEHFHRQLKASFKAKLNTSNWLNKLPLILLGIRTALKEDMGCSAAEMFMFRHSGFLENFFYSLSKRSTTTFLSLASQELRGQIVSNSRKKSHLSHSSQFDGVHTCHVPRLSPFPSRLPIQWSI